MNDQSRTSALKLLLGVVAGAIAGIIIGNAGMGALVLFVLFWILIAILCGRYLVHQSVLVASIVNCTSICAAFVKAFMQMNEVSARLLRWSLASLLVYSAIALAAAQLARLFRTPKLTLFASHGQGNPPTSNP